MENKSPCINYYKATLQLLNTSLETADRYLASGLLGLAGRCAADFPWVTEVTPSSVRESAVGFLTATGNRLVNVTFWGEFGTLSIQVEADTGITTLLGLATKRIRKYIRRTEIHVGDDGTITSAALRTLYHYITTGERQLPVPNSMLIPDHYYVGTQMTPANYVPPPVPTAAVVAQARLEAAMTDELIFGKELINPVLMLIHYQMCMAVRNNELLACFDDLLVAVKHTPNLFDARKFISCDNRGGDGRIRGLELHGIGGMVELRYNSHHREVSDRGRIDKREFSTDEHRVAVERMLSDRGVDHMTLIPLLFRIINTPADKLDV